MYRGNRILAMIPAFRSHDGQHDEHIRILAERPLIYWTIQPLLQMIELDEVIVSSEDVNTQIISSHYGANVIELPSTHVTEQTPSLLAVKHALAYSAAIVSSKTAGRYREVLAAFSGGGI